MKIIKKRCLFFAVLCLLAGCSNEDADDEYDGRNPVQFAAGNIAQPRTMAGGDQVGIFMLKENTALASGNIAEGADNKPYNAQTGSSDQSSFTPVNGTPIYYPTSGKVDFVAYYPYTTPLTNYKLPVDVSDQTDPSKIDILYSNNAKGKSKSSTAIDLQFYHAMSKLSFTLTAGVGAPDLTGATIKVSKLYRKADFDLVDGSLSNLASMGTVEANALSAIVIPQITDNSVLTITLTNEDYFEWKFPANTKFEKGKNHPYTITVDRTGITVSAGNINDWNSTSPEIEGDTAIRYAVGDYYPDPTAIYQNGTLISGTAAVGVVFWLDNQTVGDHPYDKVSEHGKIVGLYERAAEALDETWATNYGATYNAGTGWYMPLRADADYIYCAYNGMLYETWGQGKPSDEGKYYTNRTWFRAKITDAGGDNITDSWYYGSPKSDQFGNPTGGHYAYTLHFNSGNKWFAIWYNNHSKTRSIKNF